MLTTVKWKPTKFDFWPQGQSFSQHSPLFFAENKDRFLRQSLIREIQIKTKRPLVVYYASPYSLESSISTDDVKSLYEVLNPFSGLDVDVMIETGGGETDATEALISMMRQVTKTFRAIVPMRAKSNGTLLCLAAESIVMGPTSELGPIDPYVNYRSASILSEEPFRTREPYVSREAKYALAQTCKLADALLREGMMSGVAKDVDTTVNELCSRDGYASHGAVIDGGEARRLGLNVERLKNSNELWAMIFRLHALYANDCAARGIIKYFEQETISYASVARGENGQ